TRGPGRGRGGRPRFERGLEHDRAALAALLRECGGTRHGGWLLGGRGQTPDAARRLLRARQVAPGHTLRQLSRPAPPALLRPREWQPGGRAQALWASRLGRSRQPRCARALGLRAGRRDRRTVVRPRGVDLVRERVQRAVGARPPHPDRLRAPARVCVVDLSRPRGALWPLILRRRLLRLLRSDAGRRLLV